MSNPHVAPVFDAGRLPGASPLLIMEQFDGETLEKHLVSRGPLPLSEVAAIRVQALAGLSAIHDR